jgi:hypothetical protein
VSRAESAERFAFQAQEELAAGKERLSWALEKTEAAERQRDVLAEALRVYADPSTFDDDGPFCGVSRTQFCETAREALRVAGLEKERT